MKYSIPKNLKKLSVLIAVLLLALVGLVYFKVKQPQKLNLAVKVLNNTGIIYQVSLSKDKAVPNELAIKLIDKVQFNSKDGKFHNIAQGRGNDYGQAHEHFEGTGTSIESGRFGADEGYIITFHKTGTYFFHDDYDPNIFITILVY